MNFSIDRLELRTQHPFVIARGGSSLFTTVRLRIDVEDLHGEGEGAPSAYYGETPDITAAALGKICSELPDRELASLDAGSIAEILAEAEGLLGENRSAKAALDGALWDLCGKQRGEPVWRLLGFDAAAPVRSSYTVAIASVEDMIDRAKSAVAAGFGALKIKAGFPGDIECIESVIAATGATIRVDANGGWTAAESQSKIERLAIAGVEFIEQPLAWDDLAGYREIAGRCPLPIVLDESIRGPLSVEVFGEYADAVNLKVSKLGGISACVQVAECARRHGLDLMMGCMIESSLGIAQALQLGPMLRWADLDGCLLIDRDPHAGLCVEGDLFNLSEAPGLGVERNRS